METLANITLVENVVKFVDLSDKLIAKSTELYRSSEGVLAENIDAERVANHLVLISNKIQATATAVSDEALKRLCESCKSTADELLAALEEVKSVWSKEKIHELEDRLSRFKEEINLHIVVDLRERVLGLESVHRDHLKNNDSVGQRIVDAIVKQQDVFQAVHDAQGALIGTLHNDMVLRMKDEHITTRGTIVDETALSIQAEHAITRREIIQEIREQSKSLTLPRKSCWSVPLLRNRHFVGRTSQLDQLDSRLFGENHSSRVAIIGLGGVGKTQIALELAYRTRDKWPECSVFWISATNAESVQQAYLRIAQQLHIPGLEKKKTDIMELVKHHLSQESAGQWLLVLDNADDLDMWFQKTGSSANSARVIDSLPRSEKGSIVFTTRSRKAATKFAFNNIIHVTEMDEDIAAQVLKNSLVDKEILKDETAMVQLLKLLTFLPLAIVQAAAYINENDISIAGYVSLFDDHEENILDILSEDFEDEGRYYDIKNPIATTWLISFEQIRARDVLAADYLSFMSCIDPKAIPLSLLPSAPTKKKEVDAIGTLVAYSFITRRPADQSFDLHRLVHLATRNWLREQKLLSEWTIRALERFAEVFPDSHYQNRAVWRSYLPHAQYVQTSDIFRERFEENSAWIIRFGLCLESDGRWKEAGELFVQLMETRLRVLGHEHLDTLYSMSKAAWILQVQGKWKEAEELMMKVVEACKKLLGAEHPSTLTSMGNLASVYMTQRRWNEAEELGVRVMKTRKRVLKEEHPDTVSSMRNVASTYSEQGRWKEAEELFIQVMEIRKRTLGLEHPDTLVTIAGLAMTYHNQRRWKEAEELLKQVVEIRKRMLGKEHPTTLTSIANLALAYYSQRRWKEAEDLGVQVVGAFKRVLGPEHPDTLIAMRNLAIMLKAQSRIQEALLLIRTCLEGQRRVIGPNHPDTKYSQKKLKQWEMENTGTGV